MKALLRNYRQSPRKVRLVADMIRGKSVQDAQTALAFTPKKSALAMRKLLASAVANAQSAGASAEQLFIKTITVDKGVVMKRMRPFARGRAGRINKTASIIKLELAPHHERENARSHEKRTISQRSFVRSKQAHHQQSTTAHQQSATSNQQHV